MYQCLPSFGLEIYPAQCKAFPNCAYQLHGDRSAEINHFRAKPDSAILKVRKRLAKSMWRPMEAQTIANYSNKLAKICLWLLFIN